MKKIIVAILLILAIILGGTWGIVATYADEVELEDPVVKLIPMTGSTFYAVSGNDWQALIDETVIKQGTRIKTEPESSAKIIFFDTQELVLDSDTEIVINQASIDENAPLLTQVKTKLEKGQIWARLLELMNPEAAFEVESANVVATVRGTSFNMRSDGQTESISVFENKVLVSSKQTANLKQVIGIDQFLELKQDDQKKFILRRIQNGEKETKWIKNNIEGNKKFKTAILKQYEDKIKKAGALPGEAGYSLKGFAERMKLAVTFDKDKKTQLENSFRTKRMLEAQALIQRGKYDEAKKLTDKAGITKSQFDKLLRLKAFDPQLLQKLRDDERFRDFFLSKLSESERRFILEKLKELEEKEGSGSNFQNSDLRDRQSDDNDRPTALDLLLEKKKQEQEASDNSSESSTDQPTSVNQPNDTNTDVTSSNDTNTDATSSNDSNTDTTSTGQPINDSTNQPTTDEFSGGIPDDAPTQGEVAVSRFEVSASQTNLAPGGTAVLSGRVYFSNGDWGDVTTLTTWTLQPDDLTGQYAGTLRGNLFVAGQYGGKAYITGAVLGPDSRTYTDKVTITVLIMGNR